MKDAKYPAGGHSMNAPAVMPPCSNYGVKGVCTPRSPASNYGVGGVSGGGKKKSKKMGY